MNTFYEHGYILNHSALHTRKRNSANFPSCFEPHYESEAKFKVFIVKISFHSYAKKLNFPMKSFALSLTFLTRLTTTWKWPIILGPLSWKKVL